MEGTQPNIDDLMRTLLDFSGEKVLKYCEKELETGTSPNTIFSNLSIGLDEIGKRYERGRFFTSDLIVSGSNMKKAIEMLRPLFKMEETSRKGKAVIGTVKGDVHDIGKTIFSIMLQADGFEVLDLGVDVSEEVFIEAVERTKPDILAMSALLTSTISNMKSVLEALEEKGIRKNVKVIVGGRPVTKEYAEQIGADEYGEDAVEGLRKCLSLLNCS